MLGLRIPMNVSTRGSNAVRLSIVKVLWSQFSPRAILNVNLSLRPIHNLAVKMGL